MMLVAALKVPTCSSDVGVETCQQFIQMQNLQKYIQRCAKFKIKRRK